MQKCTWTLARHGREDAGAFRSWLLDDLARSVAMLVPSASAAFVTVQDQGAYSRSSVGTSSGDRDVDAVLEVEITDSHVALDEFHSHLRERCASVQGWQVHPTLISDISPPRHPGDASTAPQVLVFLERLDGTSPDHFSRQWYIHAGHLDGEEAESGESRAERAHDEAAGIAMRYIQNRVVEPITPTSWLIHGYTQLFLPMLVPEEFALIPYERHRGEAPFEKWPPRYVQGTEFRLL